MRVIACILVLVALTTPYLHTNDATMSRVFLCFILFGLGFLLWAVWDIRNDIRDGLILARRNELRKP